MSALPGRGGGGLPGERVERLRVAFVAGTLGRGGAEKQLAAMARALHRAGADVRVLSLTRGEWYERALADDGLAPCWIGRRTSPPARLAALLAALRDSRPHVLQAAHFFANLYVSLAAPFLGALAIGAVRNDLAHELESHGSWGRALLRLPPDLLVNAACARRRAEALGVPAERVHVLPNVIDLDEFDRRAAEPAPALPARLRPRARDAVRIVAVGRLVAAKRLDRLLAVVAAARREEPGLHLVVAGDGPERVRLEAEAERLGLDAESVAFLGGQRAIPALLRTGDLLLHTADHEGVPNVLLEAMAAGLPVVTTAAGDSATLVDEGRTGYVLPVPAPDGEAAVVAALAARVVTLARDEVRRRALGAAGRRRVESLYGAHGLADRLLARYAAIAERRGRPSVAAAARALAGQGPNATRPDREVGPWAVRSGAREG
ncbi:MAG TPA: glycosyltransferase [Longimicrobiales bacterium]|nr:glycosyltransferase [Longimicrobiales bacterium]